MYTALEFLSVNPEDRKANADVVDWWNLHKYAFLDHHDPHKENTLHSQNWEEIGIPLSRSPGATPAHHDKTVFEDIYNNLCRKQWLDPLSLQHAKYGQLSPQSQRQQHANDKVLPWTIKFEEERYRDYELGGALCVSYLIDGGDFLQFLQRQTTGQLAREKGGLVGYVNMSVDKVAECTPWRLARTFRTSVNNRLAYGHCKELAAKEKALRLSLQRKQDELGAVRRRLKDEQLARDEQRAQFESEMEALHHSYLVARRARSKEREQQEWPHPLQSDNTARFTPNRSTPHPNQPENTAHFTPNRESQSHHVFGVAHSHDHAQCINSGRHHNHNHHSHHDEAQGAGSDHKGHRYNGYGDQFASEHGQDGSNSKRWSPQKQLKPYPVPRDQHPARQLSESALWSYIDLARMSSSRYANYIWWPERPDLISKQQQAKAAANSGSSSKRKAQEEATYISDTQYYESRANLIWTKKFAIVMDFNLFLFDAYAHPGNIEEALALSHSLLSLVVASNVVVSKKNKKDFFLNTSRKTKSTRKDQQYRYLQFRCDGKDGDDDVQRSEWMEELDYQIYIARDLLAIPGIKLKVADPHGTVWLPAPATLSSSGDDAQGKKTTCK